MVFAKKSKIAEAWVIAQVNEDNFVSRQTSYFRTHEKSWRILYPPDAHAENPLFRELSPTAHKWFHYLADKGFMKTYNYWKGCLMMRNQKVMVVCQDPADFDPDWAA